MRRRTLFAAGLAGALLVGSSGVAAATSGATPNRIAGPDRYVTARAVATSAFTSSTVAILASGESYPDALAAAYLSGAEQAPVLLTPQAQLPADIVSTLTSLKVDGVQIVGGTGAVSQKVEDQLTANGFSTSRIAGANRFETAKKVAELLPKEAVGTFGAGPAAIVVSGENYADALIAGPLSASNAFPILLTNSAGLYKDAQAALVDLGIKQVIIIGGTGAVSQSSEDQITAMGIAVRRLAGGNRYATSTAVATVAKGELKYPMTKVELANGEGFADALVGGTRGGQVFAPLLLTQGGALNVDVRSFIKDNSATVDTVDVIGGTNGVSDAIASDAVAAATGK